ncbi:flagellar biosynthesis protein FlhF [Aquabacterium sp.]|uniref:flagellar biosynthesis protein FlhF n=1 Tax=Aquabacterium sp. TaxID=1872578 RepID=UPI0035B40377
MNVKRFTGRNSREAMQKVRQQYGDDAVVLSTKPCAEGVEILAMAHGAMDSIERLAEPRERVAPSFGAEPAAPAPSAPRARKSAPAQPAAPAAAAAPARDPFTEETVGEDIKRLAMSTLSFQDYVRERLLKRRQAALKGHTEKEHIEPSFQMEAPAAKPALPTKPEVPQQSLAQRLAERQRTFAQAAQAAEAAMKAATMKNVPPLALGDEPAQPVAPQMQAPVQQPVQQPMQSPVQHAQPQHAEARPRAEVVPMPAPGVRPAAKPALREPPVLREEVRGGASVPSLSDVQAPSNARASAEMMDELRAMKGLIEERFGAIAFMEKLQRTPSQAHLAQKLLDCGFSPALIRKLLDGMPAEVIAGTADEGDWAGTVLERNLLTGEGDVAIEDQGGVFALVGSTGVGKTTTTAKLAAAFAAKHGASNLGLITLDAYRIGAHEQLRAYGRILGVPVHTAHDRPALEDLLELLAGKKLILIDTAGMAQRDSRTRELLDMLAHPSIRKLVVVNASAQGETIEDVLVSYRAAAASGIVLSKLDEAVKLGPALDAVIRHKLKVIGVANGQRVPEDWHRLSAQALVHRALRGGGSPAYRLDASEVNLVFSTPTLPNPAVAAHARRPAGSLPAGQ